MQNFWFMRKNAKCAPHLADELEMSYNECNNNYNYNNNNNNNNDNDNDNNILSLNNDNDNDICLERQNDEDNWN